MEEALTGDQLGIARWHLLPTASPAVAFSPREDCLDIFVGMLNVLLPLLLLLVPHDAQAGKDDVMIVEPAAMIVEPSADGRWNVVEQSALSASSSTTISQSREARRGKVELDLFQVGLLRHFGPLPILGNIESSGPF